VNWARNKHGVMMCLWQEFMAHLQKRASISYIRTY